VKRIRAFIRRAEIWAGWRCATCDKRGLTIRDMCSGCYVNSIEGKIVAGLKLIEAICRAGAEVNAVAVQAIEHAKREQGAPQ
jgi:hypothetical protein